MIERLGVGVKRGGGGTEPGGGVCSTRHLQICLKKREPRQRRLGVSFGEGSAPMPYHPPRPCRKDGFLAFQTSRYKLHYYETPTGIKVVMNTDLGVGPIRDVLHHIYSAVSAGPRDPSPKAPPRMPGPCRAPRPPQISCQDPVLPLLLKSEFSTLPPLVPHRGGFASQPTILM